MAEAPHRSPADSGVHPLLAALRAVHKELDAVSERDVAGRPAGWMSAEGMSPDQLREAVRLGAELEGRLAGLRLHTVAAAHESALLTEEEQHAEWLAVLALDDNGDGTWSGRFTVPDLHGHLLKNALERRSAPRRLARITDAAGRQRSVVDETVPTNRG